MYDIAIPQRINQIIAIFHRCGIWQQEDETVSRKMLRRLMYLIFYVSFVLSIAFGGFLSDDENERIFLLSAAVQAASVAVKLVYVLWKKEEILAFLHDICVHSLTDLDKFTKWNKKINKFMKFSSCFIVLVFAECLFFNICLPLSSKDKILPISVAFPLDWKNSEIFYWMAYTFVASGLVVTVTAVMLNVVIWCLMMSCSIKYQILGNQLRCMGSISTMKTAEKNGKITEAEKRKLFSNELIGLVKVHQNAQETINRFKSCFSNLFFAQITTSGICICGSVYVMAFSSNESLIENGIYVTNLAYNLFDIFMVMYFGNEIKLSSDRLSYCLFESNWFVQSESCKKCIIILSEVLKQPHQLVIGKLYPLDLETFLSILHLAYSMFNILRTLK